jgi:hypothetical protein
MRLLAMGYATGALAGLIVHLQFGGLLAAILTFWLGGAIATLAWGGLLVHVRSCNAGCAGLAESPDLADNMRANARRRHRAVRLPEPSGAAPTPAPLRQ